MKTNEKKTLANQFNKVFGSLKLKQKKVNPYSNESNESPQNKNKQTSVASKIDQWHALQDKRKLEMANKEVKDAYFGRSLSEVCKDAKAPLFVTRIIQQIELMGVEIEGIYRICGRKQNIDQIIREFSQSTYSFLFSVLYDFDCYYKILIKYRSTSRFQHVQYEHPRFHRSIKSICKSTSNAPVPTKLH